MLTFYISRGGRNLSATRKRVLERAKTELQLCGKRKAECQRRRRCGAPRRDKRAGKSASTQAGEFVREEIHHVREGKHGARSAKQAIAIGLSKARRAGVDLPPPRPGTTSKATREKAQRETARAHGRARPAKGVAAEASGDARGSRTRGDGVRFAHRSLSTGARLLPGAGPRVSGRRRPRRRLAPKGPPLRKAAAKKARSYPSNSSFALEGVAPRSDMRILLAIDGSEFSGGRDSDVDGAAPGLRGSVVRVLSVVQEVFPVGPPATVGVPLVTEAPINYEEVVQPRIEEAERLVTRTAARSFARRSSTSRPPCGAVIHARRGGSRGGGVARGLDRARLARTGPAWSDS